MLEEFVKYPPETPEEDRKGAPVCVVGYPEACGRPAVGEVWSLPFCEAHGEEAHLAARPTRAAGRFFGIAPVGDHEEAVAAAYDPLERADTDPDTLAYDYDETAGDTPYDWQCQARELVVKWMHEAHEAGQPHLLRALEPLRERATVQQVLAARDLERRWAAPRRRAERD